MAEKIKTRGRPKGEAKGVLKRSLPLDLVVRVQEKPEGWLEQVLRAALDGPPAAPPLATALVVVKPDRANSDVAPRNKPKGSPPSGGLQAMIARREANDALWRRLNAK